MASTKLFMVLVLGTIIVPSISAVEYVVGDDQGWTINFDYQKWAHDKVFYVGDKLVFKYKEGAHNVLKVNGTAFQQCEAPEGTVPLTSGNDAVTLATPGRKWYICGVARHCEVGNQKLFITVLPQWSAPEPSPLPSPTPAPESPVTTGGAGSHYGWNYPVPSPGPEPVSSHRGWGSWAPAPVPYGDWASTGGAGSRTTYGWIPRWW